MNRSNLKSKALSGVIWKGLERVAAQLVSTIVAIVLARILMPDDYSVVSIVAIFFSFCNIFISGGLNSALIQKKDSDVLDYSTILIANTVFAGVLYAVMFFLAPMISQLYHKDLLVPVIRVMAFTFFINGYKAVISAKIISDLQFRLFFWSTIVGTAISAIIGITMALKGFGPWALVAQQMTNSIIDSLILTFTSHIKFAVNFSWTRFKRLFRFGSRIMLASIISVAYGQIKPLIVGIRFSTVDLAYYNKGKSYPELLSSIGNDTLSSSLFPALSKVQDDKQMVLSMTRRFMQVSSYLVFPLMIGFLVISEGFVRIVLTDKWLPIVPYLMIFSISDMLKPIQSGNLQAIRAIGRSDVFLILELLKKSSFAIVILLFVLFTDSPVLLAVSGIVTSVLASLINTYPNRKLIGYKYRHQFIDLFGNFVSALIMGVAVYFMKYIPMNICLLTGLQILSGIVIYLGLSIVTRNKNFNYLLGIIREALNGRGKTKDTH